MDFRSEYLSEKLSIDRLAPRIDRVFGKLGAGWSTSVQAGNCQIQHVEITKAKEKGEKDKQIVHSVSLSLMNLCPMSLSAFCDRAKTTWDEEYRGQEGGAKLGKHLADTIAAELAS